MIILSLGNSILRCMSLSFYLVQTATVDDDIFVYSMISHRVPIDDMAKLYAAFDKREAGVKKVRVLTMVLVNAR